MNSTSDAENNEQELTIRATEPGDYEALWRIFSGQKVVRGTLQLPYPTVEMWRQRLADPPAGMVRLVACQGDDVVGQLDIHTFYEKPRRRFSRRALCGRALHGPFDRLGAEEMRRYRLRLSRRHNGMPVFWLGTDFGNNE